MEPTDAQKQAGNYPKKSLRIHGLPISIENPRGAIRSGKSADGKAWANIMHADYGYIRGFYGRDGDHIDVFVGPRLQSELAIIVNQVGAAGAFDEHKILLGFDNQADAVRAYLACYPPGWRIGKVVVTSVQRLKQWLRSGRAKKNQPFEFLRRDDIGSRLNAMSHRSRALLRFAAQTAQPKSDDGFLANNKYKLLGGGLALAGILGYHAKYRRPRTGYSRSTSWREGWLETPAQVAAREAGAAELAKTARLAQKSSQADAAATLANVRKKKGATAAAKMLSAKLGFRLREFNEQSSDWGGRYAPSLDPLAAYRKARRILPAVKRTGDVAQDVADIAQGKPKKPGQKRFYEKSWFKNLLVAGSLGGGILAARHYARSQANKGIPTRPMFSARVKPLAFDTEAEMRGWDVRDPRGRSARVFAPGSKRRDRREKNWNETIGAQRLLRNVAIGAALGGIGGTFYYRNRAKKLGEALTPKPANLLTFPANKTG